jgi:hypothetical protein
MRDADAPVTRILATLLWEEVNVFDTWTLISS